MPTVGTSKLKQISNSHPLLIVIQANHSIPILRALFCFTFFISYVQFVRAKYLLFWRDNTTNSTKLKSYTWKYSDIKHCFPLPSSIHPIMVRVSWVIPKLFCAYSIIDVQVSYENFASNIHRRVIFKLFSLWSEKEMNFLFYSTDVALCTSTSTL
jgi:hypothetical protein